MASPARFLFDNDFAVAEKAKAQVAPAELAGKLADAEAAGYRNGVAAAKAEAEQRTAATLERIAAALATLNAGFAAIEARLATEAVAVAVTVGKKLAPALMAREPLAEISALAASCFRHLVAAPHVVVRVNDAVHAPAREALEAAARGSDSRLVVLAEPDIAPGDCRIEWADGGIRRERAAIEAAIDEAVARYVAGRNGETYMPQVAWDAKQRNGGNGAGQNGANTGQHDGMPAGQPDPTNGIHPGNGSHHNGEQMPEVSWRQQQ
jgi:flagellar assembly protein FliH